MKKSNHEQRIIIDDIYLKKQTFIKPLHIFLIGGVNTKKTFTFMCIMQNMLQYYIKQISNVDFKKPKTNIYKKKLHSTLMAQQYVLHLFNRFRMTSHIFKDIIFINQICL